MMSGLDPTWTYEQTVAAAHRRIADDRERGEPYAGFVTLNEEIIQDHRTATRTTGAPCTACGEPWPCGMVRGIFAVD